MWILIHVCFKSTCTLARRLDLDTPFVSGAVVLRGLRRAQRLAGRFLGSAPTGGSSGSVRGSITGAVRRDLFIVRSGSKDIPR